jgi:hypothetical protein
VKTQDSNGTARRAVATTRDWNGGKGIRTPDIQLAKLALYQLSYAPGLEFRMSNVECRMQEEKRRCVSDKLLLFSHFDASFGILTFCAGPGTPKRNPRMNNASNPAKGEPSLFDWLFPGLFFLAGWILLLLGLRNVYLAHESRNWPKTEGTILSSAVRHDSTRKSGSYRAAVTYAYTAAGASFTGDRVTFGSFGTSGEGHAREIVARYPKNARVTVFYSPRDSALSVLETGVSFGEWLLPLGGLAFMAPAYFLRPRRRRSANLQN